jgi:hypothetical protein
MGMLWFLGALCAGLFLCLFIALYVIWSGQNRPGLVSDSVVETEISGALEAALAEIEDAKNAALDEIRHTLAQAPAAAAADNRVGAASALISGSSREARVIVYWNWPKRGRLFLRFPARPVSQRMKFA